MVLKHRDNVTFAFYTNKKQSARNRKEEHLWKLTRM